MASSKTSRQNGDLRAQSTLGIDLDCLPTLLGFNIRRAQIALWRDFNRNVAEGYVRPGVFSALLLAHANPGIAQIEIGNQLGIDKASVVSLIDRMEEAGWVTRKRSTDDRRRQDESDRRRSRRGHGSHRAPKPDRRPCPDRGTSPPPSQ